MSQLLRRNQFVSECVNTEAMKPLSNRFLTSLLQNRFVIGLKSRV